MSTEDVKEEQNFIWLWFFVERGFLVWNFGVGCCCCEVREFVMFVVAWGVQVQQIVWNGDQAG